MGRWLSELRENLAADTIIHVVGLKADMAAEEIASLKERLPELEREVALLLAPRDADEKASAVLEVRAGTGGDEAALFAGDLFRMYSRYASNIGWRVEIDPEFLQGSKVFPQLASV